MSSGGRESPADHDGARERPGRWRETKQSLKGFGLPSTDRHSSDGAIHPAETESRSSTPEIGTPDATSANIPSAHDDPLPFPSLRGTWRNLSIIFEGSESAHSLSNEDVLSNKSAPTSAIDQSNHVANTKRFKDKSRYSLPNTPSLVSKSSKSTDSTKKSVADKIAYFEESLRNGKETSTSSPRLKSFLPVPRESRRRSLPSILNAPSTASPSSVSSPTRPSHSDESDLGAKLYAGFLWYLNVHGPRPPNWILCNASLYRTALLLTWQTSGITRATVTLDLLNCLDVQSTPTVSDPSVASDVGAMAWSWDRERVSRAVEDIYPMHLQFDDGMERIATSTLIDRVAWVGMLLEFLPLNPPRKRVLSPRPNSGSTATITLPQETQDTATAAATILSPNPLRPINSHNRTRSTGDVPKVPTISKEMHRKPLIRRISSMSNILSTESSTPSEFGYGYVTANESSTMSPVPSRRRSVSLRSVTSFLSRRSSRMDDLSSDGSEPAAPVSPAPTRSRILLHSRSGSQESASVASEEAEGNSLGRLFRKRDASAPARLKKPKPRLPALARLTIDPCRSFSDGQIKTKLEETVSASSTIPDLGDYSRSPTYHSAVTSLPSTPQYHTASEGHGREEESTHWSSAQGHTQLPTSSTSDSLFVTASNFTSSDAWMAHFGAASRPTSPKAASSRRRHNPGPSTPGTMSSSHTFSHLFNVCSVPLPALTADNSSSIASTAADFGSTRLTTVSTAQDSASSADATLGDPVTQADVPEASTVLIDELSSEMGTQSVDYPPVPPPSIDSIPSASLYLFSDAISTARTNSTLGVAATASALASPPNTLNQTLPNDISTQLDITNSVQEALPAATFSLLRDGDAEYEMILVPSTSPSTPSVAREPQSLLPSEESSRRRVVPKRVVLRQKSDPSPRSRQLPIHSVTPNTPSSVEVSLTPVQASVFPSIIDTTPSNGLEKNEHTCEQRLNNLLEFVERTRAAQTETSAEFSEQLGRIEIQLLELGRLIRERMAPAWMKTGVDDLRAIETQERTHPTLHSGLLHSPTIVSLSSPLSAFYDEITPTSAELQASITHSDGLNDASTFPILRFDPPTPRPAGDSSISLHLSRFPEVPAIPPPRLLSITGAAHTVSNIELRDMIERLSGSIDALVTRQQVFNDALEGLQRTGVALEPRPLPGETEGENNTSSISPRWAELLKSLENFARRQHDSHPDRAHDNFHHFLDISSARTSPSHTGDVEILPALPVPTGAISLTYARKLPAPRRRSRSLLPAINSDDVVSSSKESSPRPRARSADNVVIMADEPGDAAGRNSVESSENDTLGSLVRAPFITRHRAPITRTWYRKPKNNRTHVHWATPSETTTDNLPPAGAEGDTGTDSGAAQVTRLLQESRTRQEAASTQQNEIVRYLGELNDWLSRDAIDRSAELRGLGDRLDGIQRTMMYGPAPAISLAVPLRPPPLFTALSEQSSEHDAWPTAQNDEEPIIPPPPLRYGKKPKGDQGPTILSAAASDSSHGGEEGPTSILEIPSSVVPLSTSRRSAGQRVTFATPSQDLPAVTHPGGLPTAASSIIKVSGNTIVSQPDTRSLRDVDDDMTDRRRSRSQVMKPLARETAEIVVNIPGVRRQGNSTPKLLSPDPSPHHVTAYLPLNTTFETGRHRYPVATVIPSNYREDSRKASSPVTQHHTIISDVGHAIPHTTRATVRPGFVEGRSGSRDRKAIRRPNSPPRNHRLRSRNTHYHDNNTARRSSRSPEYVIRRGDHSHKPVNFRRSSSTPEPSTRHESRNYKPRRSRSNSPRRRTISPGHRHSSLRNANPPILSPLPLHRERPLPPILTEPTVVDLHQSQRHRPENLRYAAEGQSSGFRFHTPHPPRVLHGQMPAPVVYEHTDRQSDSWAHTDSQPDLFSIVSPERRQRMSLVTTRDRTLKPSSEVTGPSAIGTIVHPFSAHQVHEAVSHQQSQPAVSAAGTQPRVTKPQGARAKGSVQQQTAPLSSGDFGSKSSVVPNEVEFSGMESLENVGVAPVQTTATYDIAGSVPTQVHQGHAKPKRGKRRKQAENRLFAISEQSEPQLPPPPSFEIVVESDQETARSDSDSSEQARNTIFLARQEERQRILDDATRVQILAHEKLILDLHDPNPTKACQSGLETGTRVFPHKAHTREFAQTPTSSAMKAITIVSTNSRSEKGTQKSLGDTQVTRTGGTPSLALHRSLGIIANDDQDVAHLRPATRPLPSTSRVAESIRSDHGSRIGQLLQSLENERSPAPIDPYSLELANERAKARRLEEEIQKTKDAIQAIKDERVAANERRSLDTLTSISQMQDEMRGQLQTITEQLRLNQSNPGVRIEEVPCTSFENDITEFVNRIHDGQSAERHLNAQDRSVAETRSALAQDVEQLRQSNEAQKVLIEDMLGKTTRENRHQQGLLLEAFKRVSTEQVKANVNEQLHEFTGVMTHEVRILLKEVGNLREQRRNLQHEIGGLLCFRSKMEPGGEFDASWNPAHGPPCTHLPSPGADGVPHQKAPGFVGSALPAGPNAPNVSVASSSRRTTAGNHNVSPVQPMVTSPPPAYAMPRTNNRGAQARAPRTTNLTVIGTSQGNGESSASRPPPGRASRKSRPKRPE